MSAAIDARVAAQMADEALRVVFDPQAVDALRQDSPLAAIGLNSADVVCVADAVAQAAAARGLTCVLDDGAMDTVETVADLVQAIVGAAGQGEEEHA